MLDDGPSETHALGHGCPDVVRGKIVHQVVFHHHGGDGKGTYYIANQGEHRMVQQVSGLLPEPHVSKVRRRQPAEREPFQPRAQIHHQYGAQGEPRYGVPQENQDGRDVVHQAFMADCLYYSKGNADGIGNNGAQDAEVQGNGNAFLDHVPYGFIVLKRVAHSSLEQPVKTGLVHNGPPRIALGLVADGLRIIRLPHAARPAFRAVHGGFYIHGPAF